MIVISTKDMELVVIKKSNKVVELVVIAISTNHMERVVITTNNMLMELVMISTMLCSWC